MTAQGEGTTPAPADLAHLLQRSTCVIFDFDGVVADSEPASLATLQQALAEFGLVMTLEQVRGQFLGKSLKTIEAHVMPRQTEGRSSSFAETWQTALFERFRTDLTAMPGLMAFLDALDQVGLPYCVASSSSFERLGVALEALHLGERLSNLFSAEQVKNGKPAPDLFLYAAAQMQSDPDTCLIIEDSPHGIRAAAAAHMPSVGFVGGGHLRGIEDDHAALLLDAGATHVVRTYAGLISATMLARHMPKARCGGMK